MLAAPHDGSNLPAIQPELMPGASVYAKSSMASLVHITCQ
jgi:hypothetical protein